MTEATRVKSGGLQDILKKKRDDVPDGPYLGGVVGKKGGTFPPSEEDRH